MSARRATLVILSCAALASVLLTGCAKVKPWERETLARSDMAWEPDPLQAKRRAHIYWSKEASLPGGSAGGGGCGCN